MIETCFSEQKTAFQGLLIEDFIKGEELSYIVLADGEDFKPFSTSQDYKRAYDGDTGLNTGGMGAYSPVPFVDDTLAGGAVKITTDDPGFFLRAFGITGRDSFMEVTD